MHLLRVEKRSLDDAEAAIDLSQTPAEILFLSFSDSDLSLMAEAARGRPQGAMSMRLANLALLKHPYSVDLYVEKAANHARFVLVRLLGGLDYWRYGVEELSRAARAMNFALAIVPGDGMADERLAAASTLGIGDLRRIHEAFQLGSSERISALFEFIANFERARPAWRETESGYDIPDAGLFEAGCREASNPKGQALIVFYRSFLIANDTAAILALAAALAARGLCVRAVFVSSLKDERAIDFMCAELAARKPDVIINTTLFSARLNSGSSVLDLAGVTVLQAFLTGSTEAQWKENPRGLGAADLAMNVVLPEIDGRLITRAIACKQEGAHRADLEFTPRSHAPLLSRVDFTAGLAAAWVHLRKTPREQRRIACVLPDYPGRQGRAGYAVGLDTAKSAVSIAAALRGAGYSVSLPDPDSLMRSLEEGETTAQFLLSDYLIALRQMPEAFVSSINAQWGNAGQEAQAGGAFLFPVVRAGNLILAMQPGRGAKDSHKTDYHDTTLAPCHTYVAFYLWLRKQERIDALIHCGTHGTLEWLPGKAVALDEACAPEAVLGPLPVIYPFIVNNPGEAAQAKRRIGALPIGHMTPPLRRAGSCGAALELESLFDEYAAAETLDRKRAKHLAQAILARAKETGLFKESGLESIAEPEAALRQLDAWLCDLKEMRIADGLHVFGQPPQGKIRERAAAALMDAQDTGDAPPRLHDLIDRCGEAERTALLAALDGSFVAPGPGGAPSRGRIDVLPTGRNIYGMDPRAVPTRAAWEIGQRAAKEMLDRYVQDHGEWPRRIILDLWASAAMRTGGEDLAHALALMGVAPLWDHTTSRVTGFEILPPARLGRPRIDVAVRISGLFRDVFPAQIAFYDQAVRAVSEADEGDDVNPLAAARRQSSQYPLRVFGAAPGTYGIGLSKRIDQDSMVSRNELGASYLAAASHAYGGCQAQGVESNEFAGCVADTDAFIHVHDQDEQDVLDSSETVEHEGGFAAAARMLGNDAIAYHIDTAHPGAIKARTLAEEAARVVRARAANPQWVQGQMRHGHRGAAEIAQTIDNAYALAVLSGAVSSHHFELLFEATLGTPEVGDFLIASNPKAAQAIAKRFENAAARGFWQARRNSHHACIAKVQGASA